MKKPIWWVIGVGGGFIFIVGLMLLVTRVFSDPPKTWWATIIVAIIYVLITVIVGAVLLILKLRKKQPEKQLIDMGDAEIRAINMLKYDNDCPDNFIRRNRIIKMVGEGGKERTPILWLNGIGSETTYRIDLLVRLDNDKFKPIFLFNESDNYVKQTMIEFAENPEKVVVEERVMGRDDLGMPTTIVRTHKMSRTEQQEKEKEEEAKELQAF